MAWIDGMLNRFLELTALCGLVTLFFTVTSHAADVKETVVSNGAELQAALKNASPGQGLRLRAGIYRGNFKINQSVSIACEPGAVFDGSGKHDGLRVTAARVRISGCKIQNWGDDLTEMNSTLR